MKEYLASQIRNVALLGHLGCGKTSLAEALLFFGKAIAKKGEVDRKTSVSDYLVEEQNRQTSLSTTLIPVEWKGVKINFLDTPGSEEFVGEIEQDLSVVDGAIVLIDATKGIEVGTERVWDELRDRNIPTLVFINKMNKENVKLNAIIDKVVEGFGQKATVVCYPLGTENDFKGFFNVLTHETTLADNAPTAGIPADMESKNEELAYALNEKIAETDEELMEKFFMEEPFSPEEAEKGLKAAVNLCDCFPILVGSATANIGVENLLDMICKYLPSPADRPVKEIATGKRTGKENEPFSAYVFKTIVDPFLGTINLFKVISGSIAGLAEVSINGDNIVKTGAFSTLMGKTQISVDNIHTGDIGAVSKMNDIFTGCTICDKKDIVKYVPALVPTPVIYVAVQAKTKQDEDKISSALQKLNAEDPSFEIKRNHETSQLLIGGQGMTHIGYILEKMKNMFKVDVTTAEPKIVYRETIRKIGQAQGKHKKQSGGAGQFGDVWIRFEPLADKDFEFASEVVGGAVPKNYFPAVEKGLIDTFEHGPLAGFPVIGVKAVLYFGSYHPVDSNEISFKIAAQLAFKNALKDIKPTILEPIMEVVVTVKDDFVGNIMGDIPQRRGIVMGTVPAGHGKTAITAQIPEAEIVSYAIDLKAMTQGSGKFTRKFIRYDDVPEFLVNKIIDEYKPKQA